MRPGAHARLPAAQGLTRRAASDPAARRRNAKSVRAVPAVNLFGLRQAALPHQRVTAKPEPAKLPQQRLQFQVQAIQHAVESQLVMGQLARGQAQLVAAAVVVAQVQHRLHKGAG